METAVRLKLNLVVLVLQDNAYGMIRWKQATDGFPDFGMTFGDPDFVAYAKAYGAKGSRVETADGVAPALEAAFAGGGVHLIVTPVDYSENARCWSTNCAPIRWTRLSLSLNSSAPLFSERRTILPATISISAQSMARPAARTWLFLGLLLGHSDRADAS
jgi:hypothetical protein